MICAIVYQLTRNLTPEEIKESGFDKYYVDHTLALWPQAAGGIPFNACEFQSKGDVITDLTEDMAADAACLKVRQNKEGKIVETNISLRTGKWFFFCVLPLIRK